MSSVDEALAQALAAEEEASQQWIQLSQYGTKEFYSDVDIPIDATQRTISDLSENISTMGENNAQYLSFMIDRYCDGIDLKDMRFRIQYMLESGVGSVGDVVNAYYNEQYIKFGWTIPIEATQAAGTIEIMVFCIGTVESAEYILKTKPIKYTIHNALPIGGGIPKPDENWFLSFVTEMDEKVATAQGYADSANRASQSAEQSKLSVDESKTHIDTVAAQVESNAEQSSTDAQSAATSATAAKESEEKAKQYVDNVLAISPAQVTDAITIDPSFAGGLKVNQLYGKSEQKQYSGKNLLNLRLGKSGTGGGVTFTRNEDGSYKMKGTATEISGNVWFLGGYYTQVTDANTLFTLEPGTYIIKECTLFSATNKFLDTVTLTKSLKITGVRNPYMNVGTAYDTTIYPRILAGDTDTGWESYVGGIPSPNPDYPQEIKSVVEPVVKVTGKNLLKPTLQTTTQNGVTCTANGDGTYTLNGTATAAVVFILVTNVAKYFGTNNSLKLIGLTKTGSLTTFDFRCYIEGTGTFFDYGSGTIIPKTKNNNSNIAVIVRKDIKLDNLVLKPMLVADLNATIDDFEPYREQSVTLTGITLNAIPVSSGGNVTIDGQQYVADYVDVERGKIVRMVNNARLLSSYNWYTGDKFYFGSVTGATNSKEPIVADNSKKLCLCNYFVALPMYDIVNNVKKGIAINNLKQVTISLEEFASAEDLKTFLANNDVRLVYPLATPTEESLSDELAEKLKALQTYAGVTNIFVESTELSPMVDLEYGAGTAGAYVLQALNLARINELKIAALTTQTTTTEGEGGDAVG